MSYCGKCGSKIIDGQRFCGNCGATLHNEDGNKNNNSKENQDVKKERAMSILAYLGVTFFLPLVVCPDSKTGRFHANQGLLLLILIVIFEVGMGMLRMIVFAPFGIREIIRGSIGGYYLSAGNVFFNVLDSLTGLIILVLIIMGMVNAANGKEKEFPIIGRFKFIK